MSASAAVTVNRRLLQAMLAVGFCAALTFAGLTMTSSREALTWPGLAYGVCLFFCTLCSLLHDAGRQHRFRHAFRLIDHCAIFILIAGTYTPFAISGIRGPFSIPLLDWVWALSLLGVALRLWLRNRYDRLFILFYLVLGWLFVLSLQSIVANTPSVALDLLGLGGITFSAGAFVYLRSANGRWADAIWHGFVLVGILLHFGAVLSLTITAEL